MRTLGLPAGVSALKGAADRLPLGANAKSRPEEMEGARATIPT